MTRGIFNIYVIYLMKQLLLYFVFMSQAKMNRYSMNLLKKTSCQLLKMIVSWLEILI